MTMIEKREYYKIFRSDDGYIVQNTLMEGFSHSHIKNLKSARWICELSLSKRLPHDMPRYLIVSLLRINDDEIYCQKIKDLLKAKNKKKDYYFNSNKGARKK